MAGKKVRLILLYLHLIMKVKDVSHNARIYVVQADANIIFSSEAENSILNLISVVLRMKLCFQLFYICQVKIFTAIQLYLYFCCSSLNY